jgi:hypothetical protein
MLAEAGSVLGIDVGFSPVRRSSAVCRLWWNAEEVGWTIERFRAAGSEPEDTIRRVAGSHRVLAAAFDGPLRSDLAVIGRYRTAERMLTRRLQPFIGKPGQSSAPVGRRLNHHCNLWAAHVLEHVDLADASHYAPLHQRAIVEAFPSSFMGMMVDDPSRVATVRSNRSDRYFLHLCAGGQLAALVRFLLGGRRMSADLQGVSDHDDRAALICALTALGIAANEYCAVGDADGWIILPPAGFIAPWALRLLHANAQAEEARVFYLS